LAQIDTNMLAEHRRSNWVRLRTLVLLRWVAIIGQTAAVLIAIYAFGVQIEVGLVATVIGAAVIGNLFFTVLSPETRRLREGEAVLMLIFDLVQLAVLLYLTGGLNNPFALLILAPVTIAATVLQMRSTVALGVLAIALVTALRAWHLPMRDATGAPLVLPDIFTFGFWIGLVIGIAFIAAYARQITRETLSMGEALVATQMALAREQKLTDLGGVVAAAAHELGTPLATIKLVSSELMDDLADHPSLLEDAALIREQADRCRDILRSMGRAGKEDLHLQRAPFETVVREAAEPHLTRGKPVDFLVQPDGSEGLRQPVIHRRPDIVHGLRNLIQNAVDFADSRVQVELSWTRDTISLRISDDGDGFPASLIGRIGDPFVRRRRSGADTATRPGYEGMGLGLFIAKTLLERSGARLNFFNGGARVISGEPGGAIVTADWPRSAIEAGSTGGSEPLGQNRPITS